MFKGGNSKETNDQPNKLNRFVEGTVITGEIVSEGNVRIDGELIGNLSTTGKLVIGQNGKITGDIICANAEIDGKVIGNIKVDGFLKLNSTAIFNGNITTHKIQINDAEFNGNCIMNANSNQKFDSKIQINEQESELVY
jgi:cytoskeletal protein CcmA (bactofilin family)